VLDIVEHDARQRDLDLGGLQSIEHQPRRVAARAVFEHRRAGFPTRRSAGRCRSRRRSPVPAAVSRGPRNAGCNRRCRR
jgi:hypothetical protein